MSVDLKIRVDTSEVATAGATAAAAVGKVEDGADRARDAMGRFAKAGGDAGDAVATAFDKASTSAQKASGSLADLEDLVNKLKDPPPLAFGARELMLIEQIKGPMREHNADIDALNKLYEAGAVSVDQYEQHLMRLEQRYGQTNRAESALAQQLAQEAAILENIRGPAQAYAASTAALESLMEKGKISTAEYDLQLQHLAKQYGVMQGPVSQIAEREAAALQRIRGPMQQYEQEVQTLERLMARGAITSEEYASELEKQAKKAGVWQGPVQRGTPTEAEPGAGAFGQALQGVAPQLGAAGNLITGIASSSALAIGGAIGLAVELGHLSDEYTTLSNQVQRFTVSGLSANQILQQQYDLSKDLHSSLASTVELYARVRESTTDLNLSQTRQIALAKEIGEAVVSEGKSADDAAALTRRLTLAFSSGAISGRELRSIMREYPEIADGFTTALGRSRQELIALANKGQISAQQIIDAFDKMAPEVEARLKEMPETFGQQWQHVKDFAVLHWSDLFASNENAVKEAMQQAAAAAKAPEQAMKELNAEYERNARLAPIIAAANKLGITTGPFDQAAADKVAAMRMAARSLGFDFADSFEQAKTKAMQFATQLDEINDRRAAQRIADDVKRIDEAMHGADDAIRMQTKHWEDLADQARIAREAAEKFKGAPPPGVPDAQRVQMQREFDLAARNAQTAVTDAQYGKTMTSYAQSINSARAELEALGRAHQAGVIQGEAFRRQYDSIMTTINDGRLPEAIKFWEALHEPIAQTHRDIAALTALMASNKITAAAFEAELSKATQAHITFLEANNQSLTRKFPDLATDISLYEKSDILGDNKVNIDPLGHALEQRAKQIQLERDELTKVRGPAQQYKLEIAALGELLEKGKISSERYTQEVDAARAAFLAADPATRTFGERVEQAWLKAKQTAREAGVAVEDYARVAEKVKVTQIEAKPGTRSFDDLVAIALLKDKQEAEAAGVAASSYAQVVDKVRLAQLAAGNEGKSFAGGMEAEWLKLKADADNFGATVAHMAVDDIGKLSDALVTMANGGQVSFSNMVDSMLQDLEKLLLKMLEVQLVQAGLNLIAPGAGAAVGVATSLITPTVSSGTIPTPDAISSAARSVPIPAAYTPPATSSTGQSISAAPQGGGSPTFVIVNQLSESAVVPVLASRAGQRVFANQLRRSKRM